MRPLRPLPQLLLASPLLPPAPVRARARVAAAAAAAAPRAEMPPAPKTFHVYRSGNNTEPISRALLARGFESVDDDAKLGETWPANFVWKPTWNKTKPAPPLFARQHAHPSRRQVYNHLRAIEPLCQKDSVFETMRSYYAAVKEDPFQHIPPTYLIEPKLGGNAENWPGWPDFEAHFARCAAEPGCKNLWLVKPTSANRGIGIEVFSTIPQIQGFLESKARGAAMGIKPIWVLQKVCAADGRAARAGSARAQAAGARRQRARAGSEHA